MEPRRLLGEVGARVRERRESQGLSRRELAKKSGLSERFLAQLEAGDGNISLVRFASVAAALGLGPADLLPPPGPAPASPGVVALLGLRGAGKSTVGSRLAARYAVSFIEVDHYIEQAAGLSLGAIFELHGEAYYRRLEHEALAGLLHEARALVLATGGSIVNDRRNYTMLRGGARTVWLRAAPEDHWSRVIAQGDARPMAENPHAFAELCALLAAREPLYARADHVIDTSGRDIDEVVTLVAQAVDSAFLPSASAASVRSPAAR